MSRTAHEHELPDAELVRQAQRGSATAFGELVSRYQDRVYNTCYRMTHNEADALDLTQSAFLRALEALGQYRERASFYTWLYRIAVNLTLSERRRQRGRPRISLDAPDGEGHPAAARLAGPGLDASRSAESRESRQRIEWALEQLEDEFRAAVILKDIEGLNYASIAEVLDVPVGTIKSRIFRARAMLRDLLAQESDSVESSRPRHA